MAFAYNAAPVESSSKINKVDKNNLKEVLNNPFGVFNNDNDLLNITHHPPPHPLNDLSSSNYDSYNENIYEKKNDKLDDIINILEEQKIIKTNQKKEEILLYFFLGIFIIYIINSFSTIGKYSR